MKRKIASPSPADMIAARRGIVINSSLTLDKIRRIADKKAFEREAQKRSGRILNNLLNASDTGDTQASKEILDRAFGKASQPITGDVNVVVSLAALAKSRDALLDGNPDMTLLSHPDDIA